MKKEEIIRTIQTPKIANKIKSFWIRNLFLFWSYAKNKPTKNSDIDLFYETIPGKEFWLDFFSLVIFLEKLLKKPVDMIDKKYLNPSIKNHILSDKIKIL